MIHDDVLADLPPARDDEPPSLRRDIADELGDHLACAFHRELVKTADEDAAKERVLERFGDPRKIARQLWWQAMWSRIMSQRILSTLQTVVIVAGVAVFGFLAAEHRAMLKAIQAQQQSQRAEAMQLQQQSHMNQAMLQRLVEHFQPAPIQSGMESGSMPASMMPGMPGDMSMGGMGMPGGAHGGMSAFGATPPVPDGASMLSLVLTMEKVGGPPATGCLVGLLDDAQKSVPLSFEFGGDSGAMGMAMPAGYSGSSFGGYGGQSMLRTATDIAAQTLIPEVQGRISAGRVDPGRYTAVIEFPNGWYTHHKIVVRPKEKRVEKIVCPPPGEKAFVTITAPSLPEDLTKAGVRIIATVQPPIVKFQGAVWGLLGAGERRVAFDAVTGLATTIVVNHPQEYKNGGIWRYTESTSTFTTEPAEDRFLVLPTGDYKAALSLSLVGGGERGDDFQLEGAWGRMRGDLHLASNSHSQDAPTFIVQSGQNAWRLVLSDDLLATAREALAKRRTERGGALNPYGETAPAASGAPADAQITTLQVRLAAENAGGPPPEKATVRIQGMDLLNKAIDGSKGLKDDESLIDFGELLPGEYSVDVTIGSFTSSFTTKATRGGRNVVDVVAPPLPQELAELKLEAPLPKDLAEKDVWVQVAYESVPIEVADRTWRPHYRGTVTFDHTGKEVLSLLTHRVRREAGPSRSGQMEASGFYQAMRVVFDPNRQSRFPAPLLQARETRQPLGLSYRLTGLTLASNPQKVESFPSILPGNPNDVNFIFEFRKHDGDNWPQELDEPFEFAAGKVWQIAIPEEMLKAAREQAAQLAP